MVKTQAQKMSTIIELRINEFDKDTQRQFNNIISKFNVGMTLSQEESVLLYQHSFLCYN